MIRSWLLFALLFTLACGDDDAAPNCDGGGCDGGVSDGASDGAVDPDAADASNDAEVDAACEGDTCPPRCDDGIRNGDETDLDCGGSCEPCGEGAHCDVATDCLGLACLDRWCVAPGCGSGVLDGDETDVDCGGSHCAPCVAGQGCLVGGDCASGVCAEDATCAAPSCDDGLTNGDETDVDCGGACGACGDGSACIAASDCESAVCQEDVCVPAACGDGVQNGDEADVDCGGAECGACADGRVCRRADDCRNAACVEGVCAPALCTDAVRNGDETDVDCGGRCDACSVGAGCAVASDCESRVCAEGVCMTASCMDGRQNGDETDVDCGGSCERCGVERHCSVAGDCTSGRCDEGRCAHPSCGDGARNGDESDVDCGGRRCDPCAALGMCVVGADCASGVCASGVCVAAGCGDGVRNGDETAIDCGGSCGPCGVGERCALAADCVTSVCDAGFCAAPTCDDGVRNGNESDVDCGGSCDAACADGAGCVMRADCSSGVCSGGFCSVPTCSDAVRNGDESDVDCGGSCGACAPGGGCGGPTDCTSGVCAASVCAAPSCSDGVRNGSESDVDCGGSCVALCAVGAMCGAGVDCSSGVCAGAACAAPTCNDGVRNGAETDVDCGGTCPACGDGAGCAGASDCASGVCTGAACAVPTCSDGVRNGTESDVDCGGACAGCGSGGACGSVADCATDACVASVCRVGPSAGFTLSPSSGTAPLLVSATSSASAGDSAIVATDYDFGAGFAATSTHTFESPGTRTVWQRVRDANGLEDVASRTVEVTAVPSFDCRLSATDKSPAPGLVLTDDALGVEWFTLDYGGARSECSVSAESGVWYFEASIEPWECDRAEVPEACVLTQRAQLSVGVGLGTASLTANPGATAAGFDIDTGGQIYSAGAYQGNFSPELNSTWGFVVDYRATSPTIYLIGEGWVGPTVLGSRTLATTAPLHAMVTGVRRKVGPEAQLNFGGDTTNRPFALDPEAVLRAEGHGAVADALVLGFGGTRAGPANARPTIMADGDLTIALGDPILLSATATDAEDGDLTASIEWEDLATVYGVRDGALGGSFAYTPRTIGLHPIRLTVEDSGGARRQHVIHVVVTGTLPSPSPVRLVSDPLEDPLVGSGMTLSADGLSAHWGHPDKMGLRANAGLYGDFWYYELSRLGGPVNQGGGLVIGEGDLDPYRAEEVPPSCSVNTLTGTWQNIIFRRPYDNSNASYGFAVDYRGMNPRVYYVIGGEVVDEWVMYDAFVPVYPLVYGNATGAGIPYDIRANFGATAFAQDPCAALAAYGVSASDLAALRVGWGAHATASCP